MFGDAVMGWDEVEIRGKLSPLYTFSTLLQSVRFLFHVELSGLKEGNDAKLVY